MRSLTSPSAGGTIVDRLKIYEGGHGGSSAAEALAALDGVPASALNQPNGIAGLDATGKIPQANLPLDLFPTNAVQGPTSLIKGTIGTYTINNYDVFTNYTLNAISGTVSISGNTITYTAPASPGVGGFIINGRTINITISDYKPDTPVLTLVDSADGVSKAKVLSSGSAFNIQGVSNTHLNTDWELSTNSDFTNIVNSSYADTANKTNWSVNNLNLGATYYVRCRYRSSGNYLSDWSNVASITVRTLIYISIEEAKFLPNPLASNQNFGKGCGIDYNGDRVAIGAGTAAAATMALYIYVRSGTTWVLEQKIPAPNTGDNGFGQSVDMDDNGTRCVVGSSGTAISSISSGCAYVYIRSGSTWTLEATLLASDRANADYFGTAVSINSDGTRVIVGSPSSDPSSISGAGAAYIFIRSGTVWTQEQKLVAADLVTDAVFGTTCSIDSAANRVVISASGGNIPGYNGAGCAYVFVRSGSTWTQETKLYSLDNRASDGMGRSCAINAIGDLIAVGSTDHEHSGNPINSGAVFIFTRVGSTWTQVSKLTASNAYFNGDLGLKLNLDASGNILVVSDGGNNQAQASKSYVYTRDPSSGNWTQRTFFAASDTVAGDYYGNHQFNISGDGSRLVIGSFNKTDTASGSTSAGAAYVFRA